MYLIGSAINSLRCLLLHEGNINVDNASPTKRNELLSLSYMHYKSKVQKNLIYIPMIVILQVCLCSIKDNIG